MVGGEVAWHETGEPMAEVGSETYWSSQLKGSSTGKAVERQVRWWKSEVRLLKEPGLDGFNVIRRPIPGLGGLGQAGA